MICVYFNPRSHERSDETYKTLYISDLISIHAPTRGATVFRRAERNSCRISIHAPTRGATNSSTSGLTSVGISIHAPTRGATGGVLSSLQPYIFQSTLPREERQKVGSEFYMYRKFQSTLPREERRSST